MGQFQCWLKPTIGNKDPNSWASSANDISGLGKAELQLQVQQVEDCYECISHGYTGYNNRDNGRSDGQWNEPVDGTNDDWWQCAQKCDDHGEGCAGWSFVYDSSGTTQFQCWLKPTIGNKDPNSWASSQRHQRPGQGRAAAPGAASGRLLRVHFARLHGVQQQGQRPFRWAVE